MLSSLTSLAAPQRQRVTQPPAFVQQPQQDAGAAAVRLCVVTMGRDEHSKLNAFVSHYLREGAERVLVLDDRSEPPMGLAPRHAYDTRVELRRVNASLTLEELEAAHWQGCQQDDEPPNYELYRQMVEPNRAAVAFRHDGCDWLAYVDMDEFSFARRPPAPGARSLAQALAAPPFAQTDVVLVPWMIYGVTADTAAASSLSLDPHDGAVRRWFERHAPEWMTDPADPVASLVYRWDLDLPHEHPRNWSSGGGTSRKALVRLTSTHYRDICRGPHKPNVAEGARCVSGVDGATRRCDNPSLGLGPGGELPDEAAVAGAYLVQHHYRVSSYADVERRCAMADTVNLKYAEAHASSEECMLNVVLSVHPEAVKLDTTLAERAAAADDNSYGNPRM